MNTYSKMGTPGKKPSPDTKLTKEKPDIEAPFEDEESLLEDEDLSSSQKTIGHPNRDELEAALNEAETKLNEANATIDAYKSKLLLTQADTENVRKRAEKDISSAHKYGQERLILELLPVIDSLERALSIEIADNAFAKRIHEGLEMTLNLFLKALEKSSVKPINPMGQPFNPELHQAIQTREEQSLPSNTVVEVLQTGYQLHDRLIRPALVVVSRGC